jgi:2-iminoacetate synthase ThiH
MVSAALPDTLAEIRARLIAGERLDLADTVALLQHDDVLELGELADVARIHRGGGAEVAHGLESAECRLEYTTGEAASVRAERLLNIRNRQDESGDDQVFALLPTSANATTGQDDISMIAVSRLVLDNIAHIQVSAALVTAPLAQVSLSFGADDLVIDPAEEPELLITETGKTPVRGWQ